MKMVSKAALAAMLLAGAGGLTVAAPADAKKKEEAAKPGLALSPDVLKQAQIAQPALQAKNVATAEPAIVAIEGAAKTDDDKYIAAAFRLQLESIKVSAATAAGSKVDAAAMKAPLDVLLVNPKTPPEQLPAYTYQRGAIAFDQRNYPEALTYFNKAKQLGYNNPDLALQIVKAKIDSGDVQGGTADLETAVQTMNAAGQKAPEDYYRYAISKTMAGKLNAQTIGWMKRYVAAYPTAKTWREVLYNYGLQQGSVVTLDKYQTVDLFRLLRQTKGLADQYSYEEYGQKVLDMGLPDEAKAVIAEGRASGKLPATGNATAILADANKSIAAEGSLATVEKKAAASATGALSAQTADAYFGKGDYAHAIPLYTQALQKGGVKADDVNTHLGMAKALSGDKAGAKAAFAAVSGAPRADIAGFWSAWVDSPPVTA